MPFSHHSHSGQFCAHAKDTLEQCILQAISKNLRTFCLTEHMPRADPRDLYPEEIEHNFTPEGLSRRFADYYKTAVELREKYKEQITLLIGFEVDWIRPSMLGEIEKLRELYKFDIFVGSVHHVDEVPIDFSKEVYAKAIRTVEALDRDSEGGDGGEEVYNNGKKVERFPEISNNVDRSTGEERLFEVYFDTQYSMLKALKPPVVGHFDLIRLLCEDYSTDLKNMKQVWEKIVRNAKFIRSYGGMVEINSAATRKGWKYPYPGPDILDMMKEEGVKFALSDDSHGTAQVAFGYSRCLEYLEEHGVEEVWYYEWSGRERRVKDGILQMEGGELPEIGTASVEAKIVRLGKLKGIVPE
ncbi:Histidinol-phosphatase [Dactylellina cionopaga]|nr:Histidinol-phosphatase [Dactylellina cionopaga]